MFLFFLFVHTPNMGTNKKVNYRGDQKMADNFTKFIFNFMELIQRPSSVIDYFSKFIKELEYEQRHTYILQLNKSSRIKRIPNTPITAYFGSLTIENEKCFKGKQHIDLSDKNGNPAFWTVILGHNNAGKTTLLRCLANLEPIKTSRGYIPKILSDDNQISINQNLPLPYTYEVSCSWYIQKNMYDYEQSGRWGVSTSITEHKTLENNTLLHSLPNIATERVINTIIYSYGISRNTGLTNTKEQDNTATLFDDNFTLINAEEFIIQLEKVKDILVNGLLPDIRDFRCVSQEINNKIKNFVEFETDYGWVRLRELGYGYQTTLAWVVDLAKKLFERYPNSKNPLHEPAIVLIDELDLHLHPEWQRKIIKFLSEQFPKTQFIATTHSPLIVQSADNINLILLEKEDDHVIIKQPNLTTYKGWTIEEILNDLMGLEGKTKSEEYLALVNIFNKAIINNNYQIAKETFDKLDTLLHPNNIHRELLELQLNSLSQETV